MAGPYTHVALLRGINVGGNNIIPMRALAATFEAVGLSNVKTYIASGNVLFSSKQREPRALEKRIEAAVKENHACDVKVVVRSREEMLALRRALPKSWREPDPGWRYYVLFLRHTVDSKAILERLNPKPGIEEVLYRAGVVLWAASIPHLTRSGVAKVVASPLYKEVTARNLNTTLKLCDLVAE